MPDLLTTPVYPNSDHSVSNSFARRLRSIRTSADYADSADVSLSLFRALHQYPVKALSDSLCNRRNLRIRFPSFALLVLLSVSVVGATQSPRLQTTNKFSPSDEAFLEDLEQRSFRFFWEQADPQTGIVADRARTDASPLDQDHHNVGSVAATGFGLTALCIGAERHWITSTEA